MIEGIDGSGKSTIASFLVKKLSENCYDVVKFEEPSDSKYGKKLKQISQKKTTVEREFHLFMKDRKVDVNENILPALSKGKIVIMDRYYYSHVYQAVKGLDLEKMISKNRSIAPKPNLTVILDVPVKIAFQRIKKSREKRSRFEFSEKYLKKVRRLYLHLAEKEKFEVINAQEDLHDVKSDVLSLVQSFIQKNKEKKVNDDNYEFK